METRLPVSIFPRAGAWLAFYVVAACGFAVGIKQLLAWRRGAALRRNALSAGG